MVWKIAALCFCLSGSFAWAAEPPAKNLDWLVKHPAIQELHHRHNAERARVGLQPLTLDPQMCLAAQRHATWMAETGLQMHSGLPYHENLFLGANTASDAVNGWIWSPAHHGNMLGGTKAGYGYQRINGRPAWVGVFR